MRLRKYCFLLFLTTKIVGTNAQSAAGIGYQQTASVYRQGFDGMPAAGTYTFIGKGPHLLSEPPVGATAATGWFFRQTGGTGNNAVFLIGSGSGTGQGVYSAGSPGSTDRGLGTLASGSGSYTMGVLFTNLTGTTLNSITLAFTAEQWRKGGSGKPNQWTCKYKTGAMDQPDLSELQELPLLNFGSVISSTGAGSLNGNLPANQARISQTIRISNWKPGEQLLICWEDADESGSDDLVAIDAVEFSANWVAPEPVSTNAFLRLSSPTTNADTIRYAISFNGELTGLSRANFSLKTTGLQDAFITGVEGSGANYTVTVYTGSGTGLLLPGIVNDSNLVPGLKQLPFYAIDSQWIDKTGPELLAVWIPDRPMKCGDSIPVTLRMASEPGGCSLQEGWILSIPLKGFKQINDSTCMAYIQIPASGTDLTAAETIAVSVQLKDSLGNPGNIYQASIVQANDPIDMNPPQQISFYANADSVLYMGDTLELVLRFSERVMPATDTTLLYIPVTIGNRIRQIVYAGGSNSDSLRFRYVLQPNENDQDGIRIAAAFSEKTLAITDLAGNPAQCNIESEAIRHIRVDAIAPAFYAAADTTITLCATTQQYRLDSILKARSNAAEFLSWQLFSAPKQVQVSTTINRQYSNTSVVVPQDIFYENPAEYTGLDSCVFLLSDGGNKVFKRIHFRISKPITENRISGQQEICAGSTPQLLSGTGDEVADSSMQFVWEYSTQSDSSGFKGATGQNQEKNYQPGAVSKNTWFRRKVVNGSCSVVSNAIQIQTRSRGFWTGNADTDWQNKNNWCGAALPTGTDTVYISSTCMHQPEIRTTAACRSISLPHLAQLQITGTLLLGEKINCDTGAVNATKGTILFNGTDAQVFDGSCLKQKTIGSLVIDNPSGVSIADTVQVRQLLQLKQGTVYTNNRLQILYGAVVGAIANPGAINGTVWAVHPFGKVFSNASGNTSGNASDSNAVRPLLVAHPFSTALNDSLLPNTATLLYNDPVTNTDSFSIWNNWKAARPHTPMPSNNWKPLQGALLQPVAAADTGWIKRPDPPSFFNGTLNTGIQTIPLKRNEYAGFNVIGNPFLSPINLSACIRGNNSSRYYWIWNKAQGMHGGFVPVPATQPVVVNPYEAFIAACIGSSEDLLQIPEESKTDQWKTEDRPPFREEDGYCIELSIYSGQQFWDRLVFLEHPGARNAWDSLDAVKLSNPDLNCYSKSSNGIRLSVDARKLDSATNTIIHVETALNQSFYFKAEQAFLPANHGLVLHDRYTGRWMPLQKDSTYHFSFSSDPQSRMEDRFEISRYLPAGNVRELIRSLTIKLFPNPVQELLTVGFDAAAGGPASIQIYTRSGTLVQSLHLGTVQKGTVQLPLRTLAPGTYLLQLICGDRQKTIPFLKQ
ncbi:MAG: T9SS type A sorting domain-containing protein [Sediminibacterium sp.]|nr:T9SS type A sorting domain-containing protein [Sediminibacterium sp.]